MLHPLKCDRSTIWHDAMLLGHFITKMFIDWLLKARLLKGSSTAYKYITLFTLKNKVKGQPLTFFVVNG